MRQIRRLAASVLVLAAVLCSFAGAADDFFRTVNYCSEFFRPDLTRSNYTESTPPPLCSFSLSVPLSV